MIKDITIIIICGACLLITSITSYNRGYEKGCKDTNMSYSKVIKELKDNIGALLK